MASGIPLLLGLSTRMYHPYVNVVFGLQGSGDYLEVQGTSNWLHNCSYHPLIRPLGRVGQAMTGL